ncbi:MAG: ATP-binding protein [Candidatus Nitrosoglobus sp.]|jgi:hypothetical protein
MDPLKVLKAVNFDWTMQLKSVWHDSPHHTPRLHENLRTDLIEVLKSRLNNNVQNPLGKVIIGPAGAGKTHFLGSIRQELATLPAWFILVDMSDVRDFWETVLLGYIHSLQQIVSDNRSQFSYLLEHLLTLGTKMSPTSSLSKRRGKFANFIRQLIGPLLSKQSWLRRKSAIPPTLQQLAEYRGEKLSRVIRSTIRCLSRQYSEEIREHQDALRAVILLNSSDFELANIGYTWLQGIAINEADRKTFGFLRPQRQTAEIVKSLSWLMSVSAPTLLAFDQLDAIVTQNHFIASAEAAKQITGEQRTYQAIIEGIANGLMAVRDTVYRTVTVLACLETSWEMLRKRTLASATDRFDSPQALSPINNVALAEEIVTLRLAEAYRSQAFNPPYPSWPFQSKAFVTATTLLPRELLKRCEEYRVQWLKNKEVIELTTFEFQPSPSAYSNRSHMETKLDQIYEKLCCQAPLQELLAEDAEDGALCELVQTACRCLLRENQLPDDIDAVVDTEFSGDKNYHPLHARIRLIYGNQGDKEQHYCFRALQKIHATAYQNRLNAALTASGIDHNLPFRKLVIARTAPLPSGRATQEITAKFIHAGGKFIAPSEQDLRTMWALHKLEQQNLPDFEAWLCQRRLATQLQVMQEVELELAKFRANESPSEDSRLNSEVKKNAWTESLPPRDENKEIPIPKYESALPVGRILSSAAEPVTIPLPMLTQHTAVIAGSGSGKTVLIKRLVEEAALLGISSVVIDSTNNLICLGDSWPEHPASWTAEDREKAKDYHTKTEVIIWTPGQENGNPLKLEPIPNLASLLDHPEEFDEALAMTQATLKEIVAPGESASSNYKMGILTSALKLFAIQKGKALSDLVTILSNLPSEASKDTPNASRFGNEMAQRLQSELQNNILLHQEGPYLDPSLLLGDASLRQARVSVINLAGLPNLKVRQQFLNQLAMALLIWIKQNSAPPSMPVRGFLVMDETKDFIPAEHSVPCKENLLRFAAEAPTHGLGLIFTTQAPRNIDHTLMASSFTQFFGKASSPATIEAVQEQLKMCGGKGDDIPALESGQFYLYREGTPAPVKIAIPLCLSYHPPSPLEMAEILKRAAASRLDTKD